MAIEDAPVCPHWAGNGPSLVTLVGPVRWKWCPSREEIGVISHQPGSGETRTIYVQVIAVAEKELLTFSHTALVVITEVSVNREQFTRRPTCHYVFQRSHIFLIKLLVFLGAHLAYRRAGRQPAPALTTIRREGEVRDIVDEVNFFPAAISASTVLARSCSRLAPAGNCFCLYCHIIE